MTFASGGQGQHRKQPAHSAQDNAVNTFAHEIAVELERACNEGKFKRLVLIAPPGFLGQLRPKLKGQVGNKVAESLGLNLTNSSPEAIKARLPRLSSL
jgi:protein required for attachment to host cells